MSKCIIIGLCLILISGCVAYQPNDRVICATPMTKAKFSNNAEIETNKLPDVIVK